MKFDPLFIDTAYVLALLNRHDQYHQKAISLLPRVDGSAKWITEAILIEIGDGMSRLDRRLAARFIRGCFASPETRVVSMDSGLVQRGLTLFEARPDKTWGLTDCLSFVVMREAGLVDALTADDHFVQAGFRALMREGT